MNTGVHRDMDSKDKGRMEKFKKYETHYANYLKGKYFSDKDIYGDKIFEEKAAIDGKVIRTSSDAGTKSYADPLVYWNEKVARSEALTEATSNLSNGKQTQTQTQSSKKSA